MVMRKISKQFDRAVLESTKLSLALLQDQKKEALQKQKEIQGSVQDSYFKKVKLDRQKLVDDLMAWKESPTTYRSIYDEIRETCNNYNTVQSSAAMEDVTHGRAKVKVDAAAFAKKFQDSFRIKKYAWSIMSDYANLF